MNRQPKWTDDKTSLCYAGILERYLKKLSPGQTRLFCYEASAEQKANYYAIGWPKAEMSPCQPIGVNKIGLMFKEGAQLLGIHDPFTFSGHALRRYFLSKLYNSSEVSSVEAMCAGRHNSVAAGTTYVQRNTQSEAGRFRALGAPSPIPLPMVDNSTTDVSSTSTPIDDVPEDVSRVSVPVSVAHIANPTVTMPVMAIPTAIPTYPAYQFQHCTANPYMVRQW